MNSKSADMTMTMNTEMLKLYAVTDRTWLNGKSLAHVVKDVLDGGATILQIREKHLSQDAFLEEAAEIKALCDAAHVPLIINDNLSVARQLGVGAHVGQSDASITEARAMLGPDAIIGVSCQTVQQAISAERNGADYLGVGAVFPTSTKHDADFVDARELAAICHAVSIPVVAIGGITMDNAMRLAGSGIAGIAVVSALFAAPSPQDATRAMSSLVDAMLAMPDTTPEGAIIDLDGTILDSMPHWNRLPADYIRRKGRQPKGDLLDVVNSMELTGSAAYIRREYGLEEDAATIQEELLASIRHVYNDVATLFPGARQMLQALHDNGTRLALFSATERNCIIQCLQRNGVLDLFDCIVSTMDIGMEKSSPSAYFHVLGRLGTPLHRTAIYEDAPYAIAGARQTGMTVITPEQLPYSTQSND